MALYLEVSFLKNIVNGQGLLILKYSFHLQSIFFVQASCTLEWHFSQAKLLLPVSIEDHHTRSV